MKYENVTPYVAGEFAKLISGKIKRAGRASQLDIKAESAFSTIVLCHELVEKADPDLGKVVAKLEEVIATEKVYLVDWLKYNTEE